MSTFIIHLLIPPLMALAVRLFPYRAVWAWVWVSLIPDLDYSFWILHAQNASVPNLHRALFHNIFILSFLVAMSLVHYRRFLRASALAGAAAFSMFAQTQKGTAWLLSTFYYFSHLLLDTFQGGFAPLWPLSNRTIYWYFQLDVNTKTQQIIPTSEAGTIPQVVDVSPIYTWLTSEQFAFILLLLVAFGLGSLYRRVARPPNVINAVLVGPPALVLKK